MELVRDRDSKAPFEPGLQLSERIRRNTLDNGLICYTVSGTMDGTRGDVAILAPPYIASDAELDEIADKFESGLRTALDEVTKGKNG